MRVAQREERQVLMISTKYSDRGVIATLASCVGLLLASAERDTVYAAGFAEGAALASKK